MTPQIIDKLQKEIRAGLHKESQVVYLLAGIRKIVEQENLSNQYEYLKFHCNWALHSRLTGTFAQKVLNHFDSAHLHLLKGNDLGQNTEADKISKMECFRDEISKFLSANYMTDFTNSPNVWTKFMYLYARVIEDCPLIIRAGGPAHIQEIIISVKMAENVAADHHAFKVSWHLKDRNGNFGTIFVINSYDEV